MPKYIVRVTSDYYDAIEVEADSEEEARNDVYEGYTSGIDSAELPNSLVFEVEKL